jgi:type IX secretion system PorP/SprF family membrane protein
MKRIVRSIILILTTGHLACGQVNSPLDQYAQLPYLQNAALSGIEEYTDIKSGFKKQWTTFKGAPQSFLLGVSHVFGDRTNLAQTDNMIRTNPARRSIKVGLSGYLIENRFNSIQETQLGLSLAVHVPVSSTYYLSLGLSPNCIRLKMNMDEVIVRDTQDPFYQDLIADNGILNYFDLDGGVILYSDRLHLGYSIQRLARTLFNDNIPKDGSSNMRHAILAGYNIKLSSNLEFRPALLFRYASVLKDIYNVSLKFRYNTNVLAGVAYSHEESISFLTGYRLNNHLAMHYSYSLSVGETSLDSQGSHEIIIGIMPFNKDGRKSAFW